MANEGNICTDMRGRCSARAPDALIADLAARQHGLVTRRQLVALGIGPKAIDRRIAARRLHPAHPGVFAVGHRLRTREATWMAAVLAAGPDAVLGFLSPGARGGVGHSGRGGGMCPRKRPRPGIEVHRIARAPDEITDEEAIPVTTPARTLLD